MRQFKFGVRILFTVILLTMSLLAGEVHLNDGSILKGEIITENDSLLILKTKFGKQNIPKNAIKNVIRGNERTIELKDGTIIKGIITNQSGKKISVKTKFGMQTIPENEIKNIVYDATGARMQETQISSLTNEVSDVGKVFLYNSQKKKLTVALGVQVIGGGLLYAEKYPIGSAMLIAENGLILSSFFVEDPKTVIALSISGILLKGINSLLTIHAVNVYNQKLRAELGLEPAGYKSAKNENALIDGVSISSKYGIGYYGDFPVWNIGVNVGKNFIIKDYPVKFHLDLFTVEGDLNWFCSVFYSSIYFNNNEPTYFNLGLGALRRDSAPYYFSLKLGLGYEYFINDHFYFNPSIDSYLSFSKDNLYSIKMNAGYQF